MNETPEAQCLPDSLKRSLQARFNAVHLLGVSGRVHNAEAFDLGMQRFSESLVLVGSDCANQPVQRFAASDAQRLSAIHDLGTLSKPHLVLGVRGGYGITRLLSHINFPQVCRALSHSNSVLCAHSDFTALQTALLTCAIKHGLAIPPMLQGPMLCVDFGEKALDVDMLAWFENALLGFPLTLEWQLNAPRQEQEIVEQGTLWGGNLSMLVSLLGTPYFPNIQGGLLFVEDVNEHPYRIERMLLQLVQAGVLQTQKALLVGACSDWKASPLDNGYNLDAALAHVQCETTTPIIQGLPFGHIGAKASLPVGQPGQIDLREGQAKLTVLSAGA